MLLCRAFSLGRTSHGGEGCLPPDSRKKAVVLQYISTFQDLHSRCVPDLSSPDRPESHFAANRDLCWAAHHFTSSYICVPLSKIRCCEWQSLPRPPPYKTQRNSRALLCPVPVQCWVLRTNPSRVAQRGACNSIVLTSMASYSQVLTNSMWANVCNSSVIPYLSWIRGCFARKLCEVKPERLHVAAWSQRFPGQGSAPGCQAAAWGARSVVVRVRVRCVWKAPVTSAFSCSSCIFSWCSREPPWFLQGPNLWDGFSSHVRLVICREHEDFINHRNVYTRWEALLVCVSVSDRWGWTSLNARIATRGACSHRVGGWSWALWRVSQHLSARADPLQQGSREFWCICRQSVRYG